MSESEEKVIIGPKSRKQKMILSTQADTAIVGGAMGSGKSYIGLLFPLLHADDPYFRGIIFRKTTGEITAQGGLWENACEIYEYVFGKDENGKSRIKIQRKELKITFPSGASVKFSHMEHEQDRIKHQGAQYTFCLFDEATHFSKICVEYLDNRIRSARAKHKKQMILTCNPDPDWFGLDWIRPYLLPDGTPNPEMDGVVRYYVVENSQYIWADDREELEKIYGNGEDSGIKSFTFISANCLDNPVLLKNDPSYVSKLKSKPFVDVQRYLYGNWLVRPDTGGFFKRSWVKEIDTPPPATDFVRIIRAYDFAGTLPSDMNGFRCDYTACVKMGKLKTGDYVILDVVRTHIRFGQWLPFILENAQKDGIGVEICLPVDPNPAAAGATQELVKSVIEAGYRCTKKRASSAKLDRFRLFASASEAGLISVVKGCATDVWAKSYGDLEFYYNEMEAFDGGRKGHDDCCDCTSDAFNYLVQQKTLASGFLSGMKSFDTSNKSPLLNIK